MKTDFVGWVILGVWAASSLPGAAAKLSWDVCTKDEKGKQVCTQRVPKSARIAVAAGCGLILILLGVMVYMIIRTKRAAAKAKDEEYAVEASQVEGPPTIVDTEYHPKSGPQGVYSGGNKTPPEMSGPTYPVAAQVHRTYTAPASQVQFPNPTYPTSRGYQQSQPSVPQSAFIGGSRGGYPRPLLAGNRLKDRLKERPASPSSMIPSSR